MKVIYVILTTTVVCCSCKNTMQQETAYEGKDISGIIRISIDKDTKVSTLTIETNGKWALYSGSSVDNIDFSNPIAKHPEPEGQDYNRITLPLSQGVIINSLRTKGKQPSRKDICRWQEVTTSEI